MLRTLFITICTAILGCITTGAQGLTEADARRWCDTRPLSAVEGIWEYPQDGARVLIRKDISTPGSYSIIMLSTPDCRLEPGDTIGRLSPSADPRQFRLRQMTRKEDHTLIKPCDCAASLSSDGESLRVKSLKIKLKININTLLPRFWRLVRISVSDPVEDLPAGLVKIYPGYDHNGSLRRKIRVL